MRLLIDADIVAFRAAAKTERVTDWGDDIWTLSSDLRQAIGHMQMHLADIVMDASQGRGGCTAVMCFSDHMNWRKIENPLYKYNRKNTRKPVCYKPLVDWMSERMPVLQMPYLEADDVMGIEATRNPDTTIVCTIDKDLLTVPSTNFNWDKDNRPKEVSVEEANVFFYTQCLTGDATDGYPGLKGCGPVAAKKILATADASDEVELWSRVVAAYEKKGFDYEFCVSQSRMARICQDGDWDFDKKKMIWTPPEV